MSTPLQHQIKIASAWAADHPDDVEANKGVALAYQDHEVFDDLTIAQDHNTWKLAMERKKTIPQRHVSQKPTTNNQNAVEVYLSFAKLMERSDKIAAETWRRIALRAS